MPRKHPRTRGLLFLVVVLGVTVNAQTSAPIVKPTLPNPYRLDPAWPTLPATMKGPNGRMWGEVIRVHVAPGGNIWVFHRCFNDQPNGDASCLNRGSPSSRAVSDARIGSHKPAASIKLQANCSGERGRKIATA